MGEFGVGTTMAAVACAYARATGKTPTSFPINHDEPLAFVPYPTSPPVPQSPTDGGLAAAQSRARVSAPRRRRKRRVHHKAH